MGQDTSAGGAALSDHRDPEQLRAQIEQTRHELGDTVEALAEKTDVKRQVKHRVEEARHSLADRREALLGKAASTGPTDGTPGAVAQLQREAREHPVAVAAGVALIFGYLTGRRSRRG